MEAALRTAYYLLKSENPPEDAFKAVRSTGFNENEGIQEADFQIDSPYNTYKNTGLPAGPICNPGLASIQAALNPDSTNYYYYALDTATKTHKFFSDYASHEAFVATQNYG